MTSKAVVSVALVYTGCDVVVARRIIKYFLRGTISWENEITAEGPGSSSYSYGSDSLKGSNDMELIHLVSRSCLHCVYRT